MSKEKWCRVVAREVRRSPKYTQTMFHCRYGTRKVTDTYATCLFAVEEARKKGFKVLEWDQ